MKCLQLLMGTCAPQCCAGPARQTASDLQEPSTCHYVMSVRTPRVCPHPEFMVEQLPVSHILCSAMPVQLGADEKVRRQKLTAFTVAHGGKYLSACSRYARPASTITYVRPPCRLAQSRWIMRNQAVSSKAMRRQRRLPWSQQHQPCQAVSSRAMRQQRRMLAWQMAPLPTMKQMRSLAYSQQAAQRTQSCNQTRSLPLMNSQKMPGHMSLLRAVLFLRRLAMAPLMQRQSCSTTTCN